MMAKLISSNQRDWHERLPAIAFAYRTSVHESTGYTPFYLLFGRDARIPADIVFGAPPDDHLRADTLPEFVDAQQQRLREAYELAREDLKGSAQRRKHHYDLRTKARTYSVGSWVWCLDPRRRAGRYKKWLSPFCGPFQVTRQLGPVMYKIQQGPRTRPRIVHVDKLKECLTLPQTDTRPTPALRPTEDAETWSTWTPTLGDPGDLFAALLGSERTKKKWVDAISPLPFPLLVK